MVDLDADVIFTGDLDEDEYYYYMKKLGDINGDDVSDLVIGSPNNDLPFGQGTRAGSVYIIPGIGL